MTTQRIQLEISNDIFDKVMSFLDNLPKNKIKLNLDSSSNKTKNEDIFTQTAGILTSEDIDPIMWQNNIRNEWKSV